jgi:hypothetical protein
MDHSWKKQAKPSWSGNSKLCASILAESDHGRLLLP